MKFHRQLKDRGSLSLRPFNISDFRPSFSTILASTVMTYPAGLQLKEEEEHVDGFSGR